METLIFAALIFVLLLITFSALSAGTSEPQVIIVQREAPAFGCLPLVLIGFVVVLLLILIR